MRTWLIGVIAVAACSVVEPGPDTEVPPANATAIAVAKPKAATRTTVEVDGHPIAVWTKKADGARASFLLIHGRTWSARPDFDLQVPGEDRSLMDALVAQGYHVYAVDLRGYGDTPRDDTGWLTPDRAAKDVRAVCEFIARDGGGPPHVLGWSMGSLVAQLVAQRHPAVMKDLILYGYPRDPDALALGRTAAVPPRPKGAPPKTKTTRKAAAEDFLIPGTISKAAVEAFVDLALATDPVKADWAQAEQFAALDPGKVTVATLVIHGARDPYAPVRNQAKLFTRLGTADRQWVILPNADHAAHLETAGPRFVHAVVAFVQRPR